jgi:hypothetical protein
MIKTSKPPLLKWFGFQDTVILVCGRGLPAEFCPGVCLVKRVKRPREMKVLQKESFKRGSLLVKKRQSNITLRTESYLL